MYQELDPMTFPPGSAISQGIISVRAAVDGDRDDPASPPPPPPPPPAPAAPFWTDPDPGFHVDPSRLPDYFRNDE